MAAYMSTNMYSSALFLPQILSFSNGGDHALTFHDHLIIVVTQLAIEGYIRARLEESAVHLFHRPVAWIMLRRCTPIARIFPPASDANIHRENQHRRNPRHQRYRRLAPRLNLHRSEE